MNTEQIAKRLVELCRTGDYETCYSELYSPDIISHEASDFGGGTVTGLDAIHEKGKMWKESMQELLSSFADDAIVSTNSFACVMGFSAIMRDGTTMDARELAIYKVSNGKIIEEWFMM